jgi:hypothetical protein
MENATTFGRQAEAPPAGARVAEIGEILATGLWRLSARKSTEKSHEPEEKSLDFTAVRSGHPTPVTRRMPDA